MSPPAGPGVYALPPGADFARGFAAGYHHWAAALPLAARARAVVLVNTSRARLEIEAALADLAPAPGPIPTLRLIPDLADDLSLAPDLPPAIAPLRRQLQLTRLVERFLIAKRDAGEGMAPLGAAADLADELALLIDQFHDQGVSPELLDSAPADLGLPADSAKHWEDTLTFVDIVRRTWPAIREEQEGGRLDARDRQRRVIEILSARWRTAPPAHPVIAAASTGSVGSTAELMAAVAGLPMGVVVLPGFDPETEPEIWQSAGPDHPMGPFRGFLDRVGMAPGDVQDWQSITPSPRRALMAQALRPAPVTDHWHLAAPALQAEVGAALDGLALLEADSPRHEAAAIAVAIREALEEPEKRIALITPDAELARRVSAALGRFDVVPDDTMGQPLAQSVPGVLARLVLDVATGEADQVGLAALLQHPLVQPGIVRGRHLELARSYERAVLRGSAATLPPGRFPAHPGEDADVQDWLTALDAALAPLGRALRDRAGLGALVEAHMAVLATLTDAGDGEGPAVWQDDSGDALLRFLTGLASNADALGPGPVTDYPALLAGLMRGEQLRPKPRQPHPRVGICGTREARIEGADFVILAGLNDGIWPAAPDPGPWLNRPMHAALGLPLPERAVGLSAHDFLQGVCRPRVLMTRSRRIEGAPSVASRWLVRLETLLKGIGCEERWDALRAAGRRYDTFARVLAQPQAIVPRASRPRPVPPRSAVPRRLSVTEIETLVRDAYAIYAKKVLCLRPLEPLARLPDARERGKVLHDILKLFIDRTPDWPRADAARCLEETADEVLAARDLPVDLRRVWRARIGRFSDWFIRGEDARRRIGIPAATECDGRIVLDISGEPFELVARADRIDRLPGDGAAIYDYKTGAPPSNRQIENGLNHQLHLQGGILAAGGFEKLPALVPRQGAYIGLTGSGQGGSQTERTGLAGEVPSHMERVGGLLAAFLEGAPWVSLGRPYKATFESDYHHLARKAEWIGEDDLQ